MAKRVVNKKKWTIMVYLAGDNDLESAGSVDLAEMKQIGSNDDLNIIAQFDRAGSKVQTRRYYLRKGTQLGRDIVQSLGETNMGSPKVLREFLEWGAKHYPAERYMVVLWNHGAGWDDANIYRAARGTLRRNIAYKGEAIGGARRGLSASVPLAQVRAMGRRRFRRALFASTIEQGVTNRAIAFDDQAQDFLDNIELKRVLGGARKIFGQRIDVLGMDACLMSMAEVAYQLRGAADHLVGSQETEPTNGWPYNTILRELARQPDMAPVDLAELVVTKYLASYRRNAGVTQAALKLSAAKGLGQAIDALGKALERALRSVDTRRAIVEARGKVQSYETPEYVDLIDLCELVNGELQVPTVRAACDRTIEAARAMIVRSGSKGDTMQHSNGLSIYFPERGMSNLYLKLDIAKSSRWNEFLSAYAQALTRRG